MNGNGNFGYCRACRQQIKWIKTAAGKTMPVDPLVTPYWPSEGASGKIVTPEGAVVSCEFTGPRDTAKLGFVSHFATCPAADRFRRGKK